MPGEKWKERTARCRLDAQKRSFTYPDECYIICVVVPKSDGQDPVDERASNSRLCQYTKHWPFFDFYNFLGEFVLIVIVL